MELTKVSVKLELVQNQEPENIQYSAPNLKEKVETLAVYTPNNPPWNGWSAIGVWLASIIFIVVIPSIFVLPYIAVAGQTLDLSDQAKVTEFAFTDPTAIFLQLASIIPAHLLTILLAWLVVTNFRKYSFKEMLGWQWNGFKVWHSFVIFVLFYATAMFLVSIFGDVENDFEKMLKNSRTAVYFTVFFATFTAPLVEEVVYRGLLYSAFQRKFGVPTAVFLVTLIFTAVHVPQYYPDYATIIAILLLSLTLTLIRVRTDNLLPCIVLHTVINGVQSVFLVLAPFLENWLKDYAPKTTEPTAAILKLFI